MVIIKNLVWIIITLILALGGSWLGYYIGWFIQYSTTDCEYLCILGPLLGSIVGFIFVFGESVRRRKELLKSSNDKKS